MADWISVAQDGLLSELAELDADQEDGYLQRREAFQGADAAELMETLELAVPAVVVSFRNGKIEAGPFLKRDDATLRYRVWCVALNLRGQEDAAQGDSVSADPGAFDIAKDVLRLLRRKRLTAGDKDTLGVTFTGLEWIESAQGLAVVRLDCEVTIPQIEWDEV
ncbi:hypothetical protein JXA32_03005 [Candidatus Sumerlaeota bacterium]|nr:hypothetical protein [Candidatus Sumerlaeota bacterium]